MQLGITVDMSGPTPKLDMERVLEAERLGFSQVWTGEAYGTDSVTPITWILSRTTKIKAGTGIMQIPARTPACAAMTRPCALTDSAKPPAMASMMPLRNGTTVFFMLLSS